MCSLKKGQILVCGTGNASHVMGALLETQTIWQTTLLSLSQQGERFRQAMGEEGIHCQVPAIPGQSNRSRIGHPQIGGVPDLVSLVPEADVLFMAMPAFGHESYLKALLPHISSDTTLVIMPAYGCTDLLVQMILRTLQGGIPHQFHLVLLEQLPWVCRTHEFGRRVELLAHKREVNYVAMGFGPEGDLLDAEPTKIAKTISILESIYQGQLKCKQSAGYSAALALSLSNPNAIMHAALMFGFYQCADGLGYGREHFETQPLFYQEFSQGAVNHMEALSHEVLEVKHRLLHLRPSLAPSLWLVRSIHQWMQEAYGEYIQDLSTLASCLRTNSVTRTLQHPMTPDVEQQGYRPNFQHRYITEDIPYGLLPLKGYAELIGVLTPALDEVLNWAQGISNTSWLQADQIIDDEQSSPGRTPQRFGISDIQVLLKQYRP